MNEYFRKSENGKLIIIYVYLIQLVNNFYIVQDINSIAKFSWLWAIWVHASLPVWGEEHQSIPTQRQKPGLSKSKSKPNIMDGIVWFSIIDSCWMLANLYRSPVNQRADSRWPESSKSESKWDVMDGIVCFLDPGWSTFMSHKSSNLGNKDKRRWSERWPESGEPESQPDVLDVCFQVKSNRQTRKTEIKHSDLGNPQKRLPENKLDKNIHVMLEIQHT